MPVLPDRKVTGCVPWSCCKRTRLNVEQAVDVEYLSVSNQTAAAGGCDAEPHCHFTDF